MNRVFKLWMALCCTVKMYCCFFFAVLLALCGVAFAQGDAPVLGPVHMPDYIWALASAAIGWLVKEISSPLTALLKKRLKFEGNITRYVYVVLSAVFVAGFGLATGAFGAGVAGWWAASGALLTAIIKGFGDYQKQVDAARAGGSLAVPAQILTPAVDAGYLPATWADLQVTSE